MRALLLVLLLSGCALSWTPEPTYALPVLFTAHVDFPCGHKDWNGCWNYQAQTIELKKGMTREEEDCVKKHERKHSEGWTHEDQSWLLRMDCGNDSTEESAAGRHRHSTAAE